jgi:hypothetical protein
MRNVAKCGLDPIPETNLLPVLQGLAKSASTTFYASLALEFSFLSPIARAHIHCHRIPTGPKPTTLTSFGS